MSATTRPATDAPRDQGDTFDAEYAALVAGQGAPDPTGEPARREPPQTPETEDEGRPTPPRDERGRFASPQQEAQPQQQAPPAQESAQPQEQPPQEQPADETAQLRARLEQLEQSYTGNLNQLRTQNQQLQQQLQRGEQTWREQYETRIAAERKRQTDALEVQLANSPDLTDREKNLYRAELKAQFLEEDGARKEADWQQREQQYRGLLGQTVREQRLQQLPGALEQYVPHMAGLAAQLTGVAVTPEEARAFVAEPWVQEQARQVLVADYPDEIKRGLMNELGNQQARILGERSRVAAERRDFAAQQQLATNRANAAAGGATRELVPGSAGPTDPDLARYQSRPGNEGDHFDALWAATRQEQ